MNVLPDIVINLNIHAESELGALRSLIALAETTGKVLDKNLLSNDSVETTLYHRPGQHVCAAVFPIFTEGVSEPIVVIGKVKENIGYCCTREECIDLTILVAIPLDKAEAFYPFLLNLRFFLSDKNNRQKLRKIQNPEEAKKMFLSLFAH